MAVETRLMIRPSPWIRSSGMPSKPGTARWRNLSLQPLIFGQEPAKAPSFPFWDVKPMPPGQSGWRRNGESAPTTTHSAELGVRRIPHPYDLQIKGRPAPHQVLARCQDRGGPLLCNRYSPREGNQDRNGSAARRTGSARFCSAKTQHLPLPPTSLLSPCPYHGPPSSFQSPDAAGCRCSSVDAIRYSED